MPRPESDLVETRSSRRPYEEQPPGGPHTDGAARRWPEQERPTVDDESGIHDRYRLTDASRTESVERVARKSKQVISYLLGVLATLLALRMLLLAVGANPGNPFFNLVLAVTGPFVAPFADLVETPRLGRSVLELGTAIAIVVYFMAALALCRLVDLIASPGHET